MYSIVSHINCRLTDISRLFGALYNNVLILTPKGSIKRQPQGGNIYLAFVLRYCL